MGCANFANVVCCPLNEQVIVNEENAHDTAEFISKRLTAIKNQRSSGELEDLALIIGALRVLTGYSRHANPFQRREEPHICPREGAVKVLPGAGSALQSCHLLCVPLGLSCHCPAN